MSSHTTDPQTPLASTTLNPPYSGLPRPSQEEQQEAVRTLLRGLGEDPNREGLLDTPRRVVKALAEMTAGKWEDPQAILGRTFTCSHPETVSVGPIDFTSLCEHHLLPFVGFAFVSYMPAGRVVGLSKIPRLVECFARRPQLQEQLTDQIAAALATNVDLAPLGVAVHIEAHHSCMGCRGVKQANARMFTQSFLGLYDYPEKRREFLELVRHASLD